MPLFTYRGRDKEGRLRVGQRSSISIDTLNAELIKEGIFPIQITPTEPERSYLEKLRGLFQSESLPISELSIFARQMQLLHDANVPIITALQQLQSTTRSKRLAKTIEGLIENLEKGQSLAVAMQQYPAIFSPLIVNIVQIGESTGHLGESFSHIHEYLEFEASTIKQIKTAFRYPTFVFLAIVFAFIILNLFVIPTFARFYINLEVNLPWQTRFLIGISNFTVNYGLYLLVFTVIASIWFLRYLKTPDGKYRWDKFLLKIPFIGKLIKRVLIIRFCESLSIILNAGVSVNQGLLLIKNTIINAYIAHQVTEMLELIERGVPFTQAIAKVELFTPIENQILSVGEKNGELSPALSYIAKLHNHEISYDLKRMNDLIGPILISAVAILILIVALGIYLPIWNMINLTRG